MASWKSCITASRAGQVPVRGLFLALALLALLPDVEFVRCDLGGLGEGRASPVLPRGARTTHPASAPDISVGIHASSWKGYHVAVTKGLEEAREWGQRLQLLRSLACPASRARALPGRSAARNLIWAAAQATGTPEKPKAAAVVLVPSRHRIKRHVRTMFCCGRRRNTSKGRTSTRFLLSQPRKAGRSRATQ